jgi:hypothetical protein
MVLIFGWGNGQAEDRGEVVPIRCPNCQNDVFLHEVRSTKRISLYFVPVMPYGADEYLVCPICGRGLQVRPEHRSAVDAMRAATTAMRHGGLAEPAYRTRIDAFWRSMGVTLSGGTPSATGTEEATMAGRPAAGASGRASPSSVETSIADRLADLARLHADGILTDDEFGAAKRHILE